MSRLRTVSPASRSWTRRRTGRGFRYVDSTGAPLDAVSVARIRALVIPPAWQDVWICGRGSPRRSRGSTAGRPMTPVVRRPWNEACYACSRPDNPHPIKEEP
ncbi:MAG: topoisomerase [Pseudonocardiales bacterium]|nr:topoisomerase [Pseudonocardiales bacterium]